MVLYMSTTEITYTTGTYYGEGETLHTWTIADEAGTAAELYIHMDSLTVSNIETREDRRGEGLARSLWEAANATLGTVYHDLPAHRTYEGDCFAQAVGGESATECTITFCNCND